MTVNLMCQMPEPTDATSLYRGVGPLQSLARQLRGKLALSVGAPMSWASLKTCDAVFIQRPALDNHVKMIEMAKANRKQVWIDYDDWLYGVPFSNRASRIYNKPAVQNNMSAMLAKADIVSVSTPYLAEQVRGILRRIQKGKQTERGLILDPSKVVVLPNAYDLDLMNPLTDAAKPPHQNKICAWRGSGTHDKDLLGVTPALERVVSRNLTWTYNFIGEPFWLTLERLDAVEGVKESNIQVTETIDPIDYLSFLEATRPALMIVPLDDSPFNRSKSNIAWIEATHAGAVTLAPDFEEWRRPGVINYKDEADFEDKLDRFLRGENEGMALWKQSRDFILNNLTLDIVNERRKAIIQCLVERVPIGTVSSDWN